MVNELTEQESLLVWESEPVLMERKVFGENFWISDCEQGQAMRRVAVEAEASEEAAAETEQTWYYGLS